MMTATPQDRPAGIHAGRSHMAWTRARSWLLLTLVGMLVACTAMPVGPTRDATQPEKRVLMIMLGRQSVAYKATRDLNAMAEFRNRVAVDIWRVAGRVEAAQLIAALGHNVRQYDAIYADSQMIARAVQRLVDTVPIVFDGVDDPVQRCLVDSLNRPGRNATGYMHYLRSDDFKMIQTLHQAFPALTDMLFFVSANNISNTNCDVEEAYWSHETAEACVSGPRPVDSYLNRRTLASELQEYATSLGLRIHFVVACKLEDVQAIAHWGSKQANAGWLVPWQDLFDAHRQTMVDVLSATGLPAIYQHHGYTRVGGLMSLALTSNPDEVDPSVLALARVLKGQPPADLPVQVPQGFSLHINAATAERFKTRPSLSVLRVADRILH